MDLWEIVHSSFFFVIKQVHSVEIKGLRKKSVKIDTSSQDRTGTLCHSILMFPLWANSSSGPKVNYCTNNRQVKYSNLHLPSQLRELSIRLESQQSQVYPRCRQFLADIFFYKMYFLYKSLIPTLPTLSISKKLPTILKRTHTCYRLILTDLGKKTIYFMNVFLGCCITGAAVNGLRCHSCENEPSNEECNNRVWWSILKSVHIQFLSSIN